MYICCLLHIYTYSSECYLEKFKIFLTKSWFNCFGKMRFLAFFKGVIFIVYKRLLLRICEFRPFSYTKMLFTGWEVRIGRTCARGLESPVLTPREQFLPIRTDLGRWITFLCFSNWDLKVSGKSSFTLQPMCVEEGCVRVDEASDRLQTKTKHYDF